MIENLNVRVATPADAAVIRDLNTRAFGRPDEAQMIDQLERDQDAVVQIVAEADGQVIGYAMFYALGVFQRLGAAGLGPMAVDPWAQREGVGKKLISSALAYLQQSGVPIVFVLGHADYYPKLGFSVAETEPFETPVKGPNFMAVRLRRGPPMSGKLIFPRTFGIARSP